MIEFVEESQGEVWSSFDETNRELYIVVKTEGGLKVFSFGRGETELSYEGKRARRDLAMNYVRQLVTEREEE